MAQLDRNPKVRETALKMFNDVYELGLKYVKHKSIAAFFTGLFKPRINQIISREAKEQELVDVMWDIKKRIDSTFKTLDVIETVIESRELNNGPQQAFVENIMLKDNAFVPKEFKIDEDKAAGILARLKNGRVSY